MAQTPSNRLRSGPTKPRLTGLLGPSQRSWLSPALNRRADQPCAGGGVGDRWFRMARCRGILAIMERPPKPAGPAPGRTQLHDAALRHLARFSTTQAGLVRVLDRRVDRWLRAATAQGTGSQDDAAAAKRVVRVVAAALVAAGMIDDAAFAAARAARLARAGRSRRAVAAHLASKGIAAEVAQGVLPEPERELSAALAFSRRRRIGPFRPDTDDDTDDTTADATDDNGGRLRDMGALARAGFSRDIAERALAMPRAEADGLVLALKRG